MKEEEKNLASKTEVNHALYLGGQIKKKNRINSNVWLIVSFFFGKSHLEPVLRYFKTPPKSNRLIAWKSKCFSRKRNNPPTTSDTSLGLGQHYINKAKIRVNFDGSCLKQEKINFNHTAVINQYIIYDLVYGHLM